VPIRWRLTIWFSVILCVILILSGLLLYFLLQRYLYQEVDNNLEVYSARVHGTLHLDITGSPLDYQVIHSNLPAVNDFVSPGIFIQIIDSNGSVVVKSDNLAAQELPSTPALITKVTSGILVTTTLASDDGTHLRIMASPLDLNGEILVLQVGESMALVASVLRQAVLSLFIWAIFALIFMAFLSVFLLQRALEPVKQITGTAREIETSSDLNRRVGYVGPDDEIGRLAGTFDHLIAHLNQVFDAQKRFIADASHDLRSPLTVIRGNVDMLKRNLPESERTESLRAIEGETKRMSRIVDDLLLLTEIESDHAIPQARVDLRGIVLDEVRRAQQTAGSRIITITHADSIGIRGDGYRLRRMLGNLLDNAIKYTADDGHILVSLLCEGSGAIMKVTDDGIGIAHDDVPHIFDRFYRVEKARSRERGGTGLGLAIVKSVAEQHNGTVVAESEPGKGSTFEVRFNI
jgi:two-component system OmpR family sensor kinase